MSWREMQEETHEVRQEMQPQSQSWLHLRSPPTNNGNN